MALDFHFLVPTHKPYRSMGKGLFENVTQRLTRAIFFFAIYNATANRSLTVNCILLSRLK